MSNNTVIALQLEKEKRIKINNNPKGSIEIVEILREN